MMQNLTLVILISYCGIVSISAYSSYARSIPNGGNVTGTSAVGHYSSYGGGSRNAFGNAFSSAGRRWTPELCALDSDGDGFTNGHELGDPCCLWTKTDPTPLASSGLSHPGDADSVPSGPKCSTPTPTLTILHTPDATGGDAVRKETYHIHTVVLFLTSYVYLCFIS